MAASSSSRPPRTDARLNNLTDAHPKVAQHDGITGVTFKPHQLTAVAAMLELEGKGYVDFRQRCVLMNHNVITDEHYLRYESQSVQDYQFHMETNFGVLADVPGSGKTFMVLGLIKERQVPPSHDLILSASYMSVIKVISQEPSIKTNLIIVPHNLISQWRDALAHSDLKVFVVAKRVDVDTIIHHRNIFVDTPAAEDALYNERNTLEYYDAVLVSATMFDNFYDRFESVKWARIVVDEILSVKLPQSLEWQCNFLWFITATPSGIRYIRRSYVRELVHKMCDPVMDAIIVKNNEDYVRDSMLLPQINQVLIRCLTPRNLSVFRDYLPTEIVNMINAGNVQDAITRLNCNAETSENIVEVLTRKITNEIHNRRLELEYQERRITEDHRGHDETLKRLRDTIAHLEAKAAGIKERLDSIQEDSCPICLCDIDTPVVTPCCNNVFCLACLLQCRQGKCPMCRKVIPPGELTVISTEAAASSGSAAKRAPQRLRNKLDNLISLLKGKPQGKFLIFSNYDRTFDNVIARLEQEGITHSKVQGTGATVNAIIGRFSRGETKVLMLNAFYYGSGLNLQMATDVVIYHELDVELETQVIGRAQRIGRQQPLNVYYLFHEEEKINCHSEVLSLNLYEDDVTMLERHVAQFGIGDQRGGASSSDDDDAVDRGVVRRGRRMVTT